MSDSHSRVKNVLDDFYTRALVDGLYARYFVNRDVCVRNDIRYGDTVPIWRWTKVRLGHRFRQEGREDRRGRPRRPGEQPASQRDEYIVYIYIKRTG